MNALPELNGVRCVVSGCCRSTCRGGALRWGKRLECYVALLVFLLISGRSMAVDPLPPELENAPEEKKLAWRKKWADDSARLKAQVAKERYTQRMAVKDSMKAFQASLREEASARYAPPTRIGVTEAAPEAVVTPEAPGEEAASWMPWILAGGIAALGVWHLRRVDEAAGA